MDSYFPIVKNVVGKMVFRPVPPHELHSSFECNMSWEEIRDTITTYLNTNNIAFISSKSTAAFTVASESLQMDIIVYVHDQGHYVIGFHRISGDILAGSDIYGGLMRLLTDKRYEIETDDKVIYKPEPNCVCDFDALIDGNVM